MTRLRLVALGIAAIVVAGPTLAPAATAAGVERVGVGAPCVDTYHSIPYVGVDPDCSGSSSSSSQSLNASAVLAEFDVLVSWDPPVSETAVDEYQVLRGNNPFVLSTVATVDSGQQAFTDTKAVTNGEFLWYRVQAVDEAGQIVAESPILHVQPA